MKEFSATTGLALPEDPAVKESLTADADAQAMRTLPLALIVPSRTNPRQHFDPTRLHELADSIKASGVHQPILVRPLPRDRIAETSQVQTAASVAWDVAFPRAKTARPTHEIVAGERRYRASLLAGKTTIPALIRTLTDQEVLEIQIVENLQRDDLTELEEAEGYERLMQHSTLSAEAVGAKIGKSRSYVYARLKLLDLCTEARQALREGKIDASKALLLARIPDTALQVKALAEISHVDGYYRETMSYRDAASYIQREFMLNLDTARFKITDATLVPAAGSCRDCPKRTGANPDLFADVKGADVCTDPPCFHAKEQAHVDRMMREAHERGQTIIEGREAKALLPSGYGKVEGYLRLDDKRDSPTDKPLRKLIGKQMERAGIVPTLLANPHQGGELIAIITREQAAELLKAQGHEDAAEKVDQERTSDARHQAAQDKQDLKREYEEKWRQNVLEAAWQYLCTANESGVSGDMVRHVAGYFGSVLNLDGAKRICKLLGLGKVAPKEGLAQHIADTDKPENILLLLLMDRDRGYHYWMDANEQKNVGLMLVAGECKVDIDAVKAQTKAAMRALHAKKAKTPPSANAPAAPPAEGTGGGKSKKSAGPAAPARKSKTTPEEAMQGIAVAMQNIDAGPVGSAPAVAPGGFAVGQRVRVIDSEALSMRLRKHAGKEGTITAKTGPEAWDVSFKGRTGGLAGFHASELAVVA